MTTSSSWGGVVVVVVVVVVTAAAGAGLGAVWAGILALAVIAATNTAISRECLGVYFMLGYSSVLGIRLRFARGWDLRSTDGVIGVIYGVKQSLTEEMCRNAGANSIPFVCKRC
jgi:hypothetical protein